MLAAASSIGQFDPYAENLKRAAFEDIIGRYFAFDPFLQQGRRGRELNSFGDGLPNKYNIRPSSIKDDVSLQSLPPAETYVEQRDNLRDGKPYVSVLASANNDRPLDGFNLFPIAQFNFDEELKEFNFQPPLRHAYQARNPHFALFENQIPHGRFQEDYSEETHFKTDEPYNSFPTKTVYRSEVIKRPRSESRNNNAEQVDRTAEQPIQSSRQASSIRPTDGKYLAPDHLSTAYTLLSQKRQLNLAKKDIKLY